MLYDVFLLWFFVLVIAIFTQNYNKPKPIRWRRIDLSEHDKWFLQSRAFYVAQVELAYRPTMTFYGDTGNAYESRRLSAVILLAGCAQYVRRTKEKQSEDTT